MRWWICKCQCTYKKRVADACCCSCSEGQKTSYPILLPNTLTHTRTYNVYSRFQCRRDTKAYKCLIFHCTHIGTKQALLIYSIRKALSTLVTETKHQCNGTWVVVLRAYTHAHGERMHRAEHQALVLTSASSSEPRYQVQNGNRNHMCFKWTVVVHQRKPAWLCRANDTLEQLLKLAISSKYRSRHTAAFCGWPHSSSICAHAIQWHFMHQRQVSYAKQNAEQIGQTR